jgi:hypothetical protein
VSVVKSIIMSHYCEDEQRAEVSLKCIQAIQPYRNKITEFILVCNGHYEGLREYADKYFERPIDTSPGRSANIGSRAAEGNILAILSNDALVSGDWLKECSAIVKKYPMYMATSFYPNNRTWHELPAVDGYCVNSRVGSNQLVMTRAQYEDIGPWPEINPMFDGSEYINRWSAKGYAVMMTKTKWVEDLGRFRHSYLKQKEEMGYEYKNRVVRFVPREES